MTPSEKSGSRCDRRRPDGTGLDVGQGQRRAAGGLSRHGAYRAWRMRGSITA
jgi:hypothetical protein